MKSRPIFFRVWSDAFFADEAHDMNASSLFEHFSIIQDPRQSWKVEYNLFDILLLTVCAVIVGAEVRRLGKYVSTGLDNMVILTTVFRYMTPLRG